MAMVSGDSVMSESVVIVSFGAGHFDVFSKAFADSAFSIIYRDAFLKGHFSGFSEDTLLIIDCDVIDDEMLSQISALQARSPCPVLIFSASGEAADAQKALRAGASSCVIDGMQPHRIGTLAAIARERFQQSRKLQVELAETKGTLEARKVIDRAKGVMMEQRGLKESEAYDLLRKTAMKQSKTMREVAESYLALSGLLD
ncbi:MAG: hypothetical protein CMK08_01165 [Ponticaulis sp.]|jgi:response regulator NasT|nr:hypothetical protein [Ponticaulis sp.]